MKCFSLCSLILASHAFAGTITYTNNTGFAIPDNNAAGVSQTIVVGAGDAGALTAVTLTLTFNPRHTFAGDLIITLSNGTTTVDILRRVRAVSGLGFGDGTNLLGPYTFTDTGSDILAPLDALVTGQDLPSGSYQATTNLFNGALATTNPVVLINPAFAGQDRAATWTLFVSDNANEDTGSIGSWSLDLTTADTVPEPSTFALAGLGLLAAVRRMRAA